jgi:hypothetical protein
MSSMPWQLASLSFSASLSAIPCWPHSSLSYPTSLPTCLPCCACLALPTLLPHLVLPSPACPPPLPCMPVSLSWLPCLSVPAPFHYPTCWPASLCSPFPVCLPCPPCRHAILTIHSLPTSFDHSASLLAGHLHPPSHPATIPLPPHFPTCMPARSCLPGYMPSTPCLPGATCLVACLAILSWVPNLSCLPYPAIPDCLSSSTCFPICLTYLPLMPSIGSLPVFFHVCPCLCCSASMRRHDLPCHACLLLSLPT